MKPLFGHLLAGPEFRIRSATASSQEGDAQFATCDAPGPLPDTLGMPALVNAHDHGYGMATLAVGAPDDALECWIPGLANRPETDPRLEAQVAFGRMALAGIGTTVHCHNSLRRDRLPLEAEAVAEAAGEVGIRVAFACPISDRNPLVYGDPAPLAACGLPAALLASSGPSISGEEQIQNALLVRKAHQSDTFNVQLGPVGPQWCSEATLERIAQTSAETGLRIHMHLLETERQRERLDRDWPEGPIRRLDALGLLSPRLTVAHGVWLEPSECELLAERGVTVVVNASSNLRLRSGIAPVARFLGAGLQFAIGLDGAGFDDDQDMFRELRLFQRLHSGMSLSDEMPPERVMRAALTDAFRVFDGSDEYGGVIDAGADLLVLDLAPMLRDRLNSGTPLIELLMARARCSDVQHLNVAGQEVVRNGRLCGFDFEEAEAELVAQARSQQSKMSSNVDATAERREAIRTYYTQRHHLK